ncbi:HAD hydrolase-like protein [uncultured Clostridium sp.]|uniref:HAD hydrolase-like protein n=1 Tax=uncultured Clostridium sp. TaxID=59620 RepID=UPI0028EF3BAB|nr:HAD hydrolase-like protein [uncultured Clostridium sp.]
MEALKIVFANHLKIYKPHPTVYNLVLEQYNLNKNEILFVSSNSFAVAGAKSFGFNVSWANRFNNKKRLTIRSRY